VQAVVQTRAIGFDAPRTTAKHACGFEHGYRHPGARKFRGCGHAGVSAADDRYARRLFGRNSHALSQVRQAIHSLRIGVSEVRRSMTLQPPLRISSSTFW
jgi:hypothetical protein